MPKKSTESVMLRNNSYMPDLSAEGIFICPMPSPPPPGVSGEWYANLKPHERLYYHQTMASTRYSKRFRQYPNIPRDTLDYQLRSRYDHSREAFPEKVDSVLQRETCEAESSWQQPLAATEPGSMIMKSVRILSNKKVLPAKKVPVLGHPLKIGGITEKIDPNSVKLICSGVHNQLVNNGFSRQTSDGNFFRY